MIMGISLSIVVIVKATRLFISSYVWEKYNDDNVFPYDLLCAEFPDACILKDVPISSTETKSVQISQSLDILYVSRGGVIIISVVNGTGAFDNPKTGAWRYRYPNENGKPVTVNIPNPFDVTIAAANILEGLLAGEKIFLDVQRVVVFTGHKIGVTHKYPEALTVNELTSYINAFNQRAVMNGPQFRTAATTITAYAEYNQHKNLSAKYNRGTNIPAPTSINDKAEFTQNADDASSVSTDMDSDEATELLREIQSQIDKESQSNNQ